MGGPTSTEVLCHADAAGVKRYYEINNWKWSLGRAWFDWLGGRSYYEEFAVDDWEDPQMRERLEEFLAQAKEDETSLRLENGLPLLRLENFGRYGLTLLPDHPMKRNIHWDEGEIWYGVPSVRQVQFFKEN